jgi:hypothetical protein
MGAWLPELYIDFQEWNSSQYNSDHMRGCHFLFQHKTEAFWKACENFTLSYNLLGVTAVRQLVVSQLPALLSFNTLYPPTNIPSPHPIQAQLDFTSHICSFRLLLLLLSALFTSELKRRLIHNVTKPQTHYIAESLVHEK